MGAVSCGHLEVANNFLGLCKFEVQIIVGIKCNACIHRHMLVKPASPVSAPHSRTAAVTVNNRGGKAAICIAKTSLIDSSCFIYAKLYNQVVLRS